MVATPDDRLSASLETALARAEQDADSLTKATAALAAAVKKLRSAAQSGSLRELEPALSAVEGALAGVRQRVANAREGWDFDEAAYFANGDFVRELMATAAGQDLRLFERDDRLYCYPVLIRILAGERAVQIDKARERRLRPSVLVRQLKELQRKPPRFRPEAFLETLLTAYSHLSRERGRQLSNLGTVEQLARVYELLTLLPGQSREYSRQEFARDLYLLDRSGVTRTRQGYVLSLPASTGTRSLNRTITAVTEDGREKVYYGISFSSSE